MRIPLILLLIGLAFEASAAELKNIKANMQLQDKATKGVLDQPKENLRIRRKKFKNERYPDWRLTFSKFFLQRILALD